MRHIILGITVLCLTLATGIAQTQEMPDRVRLTTPDGQVIELADEHEVIAGILRISVEELQRRIDAGEELRIASDVTIRDVVAVDGAVVNYDPPQYFSPGTAVGIEISEEEFQRMMEQQRRQEEMLSEMLADVGVTEEEMEQFNNRLAEIAEQDMQFAKDFGESVQDNYESSIEFAEDYFDNFIQPMMNGIRTEAISFFTEDQYSKLTTRLYQLVELMPISGDGDVLEGELLKSFLLPDVLGLTDDQMVDFTRMQKEFLMEAFDVGMTLSEEHEHLLEERESLNAQLTQLLETKTKEEREEIKNRLANVQEQINKVTTEPSRRIIDKLKTKLDTLLTAEQKAKLSKIKQDIPDYMRSALAGMKTGGVHDNAEEASGPWRPGANSWVPGMGAPKDLQNDPREAPRIREPRDGRRFPGSE